MSSLRKAILDTALITPSGALSPGPLSASAIAAGIGLGALGGLLVALGHLIVELPYFVILLMLMGVIETRLQKIKPFMDLLAAGFIVFFAYLLFDSGYMLLKGDGFEANAIITSPIAALLSGIILTGANAYFLAWWFTVGKPIVDSARSLGWRKASVIYLVHYSYDLGWLILLSLLGGFAAYTGTRFMAILMFLLALILLYFAYKIMIPYLRAK